MKTKKNSETLKKKRENISAYRARQAELGRKNRNFYLTESEFVAMKAHLDRLRDPGSNPDPE
jgi:hypothetical protein